MAGVRRETDQKKKLARRRKRQRMRRGALAANVVKADESPSMPRNRRPQRKAKKSLKRLLKDNKSILYILAGLIVMLLLAFGALMYVRSEYKVYNVYVDGNSWYTNEEIGDIVMSGPFTHNSLFLSMKYRGKAIENIPYVEKITVEIINNHTISIHVFEKALAGCVKYLEHYMYFDREGIIVETGDDLLYGVPLVSGLKFDSVVMYEPLPVGNDSVFGQILDLTQLLSKYKLDADKISFDSSYNVTLYFGDVEAVMGEGLGVEEKIIQLPHLLPDLEGKKGILHLEDVDENTSTIRFEATIN
ncbi:cell division protein FtsQ/DivIB [Butyrivibrio sp. MC2013]|uniref:cell division protein FtsQ/DivIB n=1 Tax=Butyrivibrio sp. MC2013 TaxID=1280686 RepID=UPI0004137570|nr:hypothetical protein [Butyrivibrio sp. MC2013]